MPYVSYEQQQTNHYAEIDGLCQQIIDSLSEALNDRLSNLTDIAKWAGYDELAVEIKSLYEWTYSNICVPSSELKDQIDYWKPNQKFPRNMNPSTFFERNGLDNLRYLHTRFYLSSFKFEWEDNRLPDDVQKIVDYLTSGAWKKEYAALRAKLLEFRTHFLTGQGKSVRTGEITPETLDALAKSAVRRVLRKSAAQKANITFSFDFVGFSGDEANAVEDLAGDIESLQAGLNQLSTALIDLLALIERGNPSFIEDDPSATRAYDLLQNRLGGVSKQLVSAVDQLRTIDPDLNTLIDAAGAFVDSVD